MHDYSTVTKREACLVLGVKPRQFNNIARKHGIRAIGADHTLPGSPHLYNRSEIEALAAIRGGAHA